MPETQQPYDTIDADEPRIIVAGFGRVGQIVARVLNARRIHFVALDKNPDQVAFVRRYGNEVFYGDVAHPELLRTAGIENAEIFICAISDRQVSVQLAEYIQREYPHVKFYGRARDREHALALRGAGAVVYMRDTLLSSLYMAEEMLVGLGFSTAEAKRTIEVFRAHDERTLEKQFAVRHDDEAVFQAGKEANEQLKVLFEEDRK